MARKTDEKKLNKDQLKAIKHGKGPLLIIAGAGTGKTTVITERVKWLISQKMAQPGELLALTFTEKAAREMEERIDIALPYGYTQMWITTFHAFGEKVLRQEALQIGLDSGYKLMTAAEEIIFLRKNLFKFDLNYFRPLSNPNKFIEGILQHFSRLKDEDISPIQYVQWVQNQKSKIKNQKLDENIKLEIDKYFELANAYKTYEELKFKEGVMDFSDLISNTLKLFRVRKNLLKEYQNKFKFILIDEFQDTNFAQNELAILLTGNAKNITVVGDDDQAIYRWRGAAISNIIQFKKRFPQSKLVILSKNYRSTQEILDSSYKLIQNNNPDRLEVKENIDKKLQSERPARGEKIEFIFTKRVEDEADEVVKKIKQQQSKGIYSWKDFAILIRANNQSDPFIRTLTRAGIPYQFLGPGILFRQAEIKDLIAYLKFLHNFLDSVAFFRVLSMSIFDISSRDIVALNNFASRVGISLFEGTEVIVSFAQNDTKHWSREKNYQSLLPNISDKSKNILAKILKMINRHFDLIKKQETAGQILYYFLEDTGILLKLTKYKDTKEEKMALNISKFFDKLKTFETEHEDASVAAVVEFLEMSMELGESPLVADIDWTQNDAVNILTVHSSKGLEFPVVFLVNLVTNRFPTISRRERIPIPDELVKEILPEGDYHLEEERRLFYVGMTRARDYLFLAASNYYGEGKRERKISPFVMETLGEDNVIKQPLDSAQSKQLTLIEWKKNEELQGQVIKTPIEYLSYSQIDTFMTCPLQYKYRYILKIPVPQNAAGSFGTSIHATLQKFYEERKEGKHPTKHKLFKLLNRVWMPIGYGTKQYEEKMKKRGIDMLTQFYDKFYDPKIVPKNLEQVFKIKLSPNLKIGGKIDRVDETHDGKLEIIDYKTGKKPTEKQIKENLQMTVYGLAATDKGIYNRTPDEVILSFYFLGTQEKVSSTRTNDDLEEAKKILMNKAEEISTSDFKPKVGPWCDFCDFRLICEAWQ
ncbi:ATP-dependent helicase [Candidatus Gottesmanbacteria bacterium]|nr:ATP-dependent helicase [Candidatus Gottesmanbacteria bacterium]